MAIDEKFEVKTPIKNTNRSIVCSSCGRKINDGVTYSVWFKESKKYEDICEECLDKKIHGMGSNI